MNKAKFDVDAIVLDKVGRVILSDERLRSLEQICDVATAGGTSENELCDCGPNQLECGCIDWADCACTDMTCTDEMFCVPQINYALCSWLGVPRDALMKNE